MKLVTFKAADGSARPGIVENGSIYDLAKLGDLAKPGFSDTLSFIQAGPEAARKAHAAAISQDPAIALEAAELLAPLPVPPRIFCIGLNYRDHAIESKMELPKVPTVFMKLSSSVVGPGAEIVLPDNSKQPDYEAELAVVIGKGGSHLSASDWKEYIFGYTIVNDVSARDVQLATSQWTLGKSFPTFCPCGPWIVSSDELEDPHQLDIKLSIDGEVLQHSNTRELIFRVPDLLAYISSIVPLQPGDIISTGTPQGVGLGRTPQRWLQPGETIQIEIEGIGRLTNRTRAQA
jgi:2-keto-4-pentenoate hydratase/2-oxohepta-3-ene-1,7-dioic acid hydratase in catechol pathway